MKFKRIRLFKTRYISYANQVDMLMLFLFFGLLSSFIFFVSYFISYISIYVYCFIKLQKLEYLFLFFVFFCFFCYVVSKVLK